MSKADHTPFYIVLSSHFSLVLCEASPQHAPPPAMPVHGDETLPATDSQVAASLGGTPLVEKELTGTPASMASPASPQPSLPADAAVTATSDDEPLSKLTLFGLTGVSGVLSCVSATRPQNGASILHPALIR